jgi:hypothetical protein
MRFSKIKRFKNTSDKSITNRSTPPQKNGDFWGVDIFFKMNYAKLFWQKCFKPKVTMFIPDYCVKSFLNTRLLILDINSCQNSKIQKNAILRLS